MVARTRRRHRVTLSLRNYRARRRRRWFYRWNLSFDTRCERVPLSNNHPIGWLRTPHLDRPQNWNESSHCILLSFLKLYPHGLEVQSLTAPESVKLKWKSPGGMNGLIIPFAAFKRSSVLRLILILTNLYVSENTLLFGNDARLRGYSCGVALSLGSGGALEILNSFAIPLSELRASLIICVVFRNVIIRLIVLKAVRSCVHLRAQRSQRTRAVAAARAQHGSNECIIIMAAAPVAERPTHRNLMASAAPPDYSTEKTN